MSQPRRDWLAGLERFKPVVRYWNEPRAEMTSCGAPEGRYVLFADVQRILTALQGQEGGDDERLRRELPNAVRLLNDHESPLDPDQRFGIAALCLAADREIGQLRALLTTTKGVNERLAAQVESTHPAPQAQDNTERQELAGFLRYMAGREPVRQGTNQRRLRKAADLLEGKQ